LWILRFKIMLYQVIDDVNFGRINCIKHPWTQ